jgi:hypothetical protein
MASWAGLDGSRGEQDATHIEVGGHTFNREARRFYERFGFFASLDRLALTV